MSEFKREERYTVVKLKHLDNITEDALRRFLIEREIQTEQCVVVEADWPNYEHVWQTVEQVANGTWQAARAQGGEVVAWCVRHEGHGTVVQYCDNKSLADACIEYMNHPKRLPPEQLPYQAFPLYTHPQPAQQGSVPIPQDAAEARAMALMGWAWLRDNALEQLTDLGRRGSVPEGCALIPLHNGNPKITNEMKAECMGEFSWQEEAPYYDEDGGLHDYIATHAVPWTICKDIYKKMASVAMLSATPQPDVESFQARVAPWVQECFGPEISADTVERNHRFLEESLELVQSLGCTKVEALQLVDYVYGREVGDPPQEVGGVMVTLAALCRAAGMDMDKCAETELARIWTKVDQIRAKQASKPKHSPLPQPEGDGCCCGETEQAWRLCPVHGPTTKGQG